MPFPKQFKPATQYSLTRLGNKHDGGYLIDNESVKKSSYLLSMGISTDWSFEKDFLKINTVLTHCYDHTLTHGFFIMYLIKNFLMIFRGRIKYFLLSIKIILDYFNFFRYPVILYKEMIGCDDEGGISINNALSRIPIIGNEQVFIKMDIEGSEYRVLDEIISNVNVISGLSIEFHDADLHVERILDFINRFPLELVHSHANNNWSIGLNNNTQLLELSFSKYAKKLNPKENISDNIETINNPDLPEVILEFDC